MATTAIGEDKNLWGGGVSPMKASYGKIMMWYFLVSDAFTFTAFLSAYGFSRFNKAANAVVEGQAYIPSLDKWPVPEKVFEAVPFLGAGYPLVFVGIMTFILILSSVTMVLAVEAGKRMDRDAVAKWMLWTVLGGVVFLGCQAWEWTHFIHGTAHGMDTNGDGIGDVFGATLSANEYGPQNFAQFFFFITGFHGTHVLSGIIINLIIFYRAATGLYEERGHYEMIEKVGLYWHFVDLVWVFVFTFFYLV